MSEIVRKLKIVLFTSLVLLSHHVFADLAPYKADYDLLQDDDQVGNASWTLTQKDNSNWQMETRSRARLFFVKIVFDQSAEFSYQDGLITPLSFNQLSDTGVSSERRMNQTFDWESGTDTGKYKKDSWSRELNPGSLSRVTDVIQFQQQLQKAKEPIKEASFEINYRGSAKTESYSYLGEEELATPSGTYQALKYKKLHSNPDRITYFWFVPELNYIPGRIQQIHTGEEQANMLLRAIEFK